MTDYDEIENKLKKARQLQNEAKTIILEHYPVGHKLGCYFRSGQKNPTPVTVVGASGAGYGAGCLRVETASGKLHNVYYTNVTPL